MKRELEHWRTQLNHDEEYRVWTGLRRALDRRRSTAARWSRAQQMGVLPLRVMVGAGVILLVVAAWWLTSTPPVETGGGAPQVTAIPDSGETPGVAAVPDRRAVNAVVAVRNTAASVGTLRGSVRAQGTQEPLCSANVLVLGTTWGAMTLEDGTFRILSVPAGTYDLRVLMMGYGEQVQRGIEVRGGQEEEVAFELESEVVATLAEVQISGKREKIDRIQTGTAHTISAEDLSDLPADNIEEVIRLQAGVITKGNELHFRGGRAGKVQYQVDGVPVREKIGDAQFRPFTPPSPSPVNVPRRPPYPSGTGGGRPVNAELADDMFFEHAGTNPFVIAAEDSQSTFALDVDTGSYTISRRYIHEGHLPPTAAVRVEEFVNYFRKDYAPPESGDFSIHIDGMPSPFAHVDDGSYRLLRVGVRGRVVTEEQRLPAQLALVIDTSGSMEKGGRLEVVKAALDVLFEELRPDDRVGVIAFGPRAEVIHPLGDVGDASALREKVWRLRPHGGTNAGQGLDLGYGMLRGRHRPGWINRILFFSDGVANLEVTGWENILRSVRDDADQITLSTIGVGLGNYNDVLMEQLADAGDGNYAYVDDMDEAVRVLRENLVGTLQIIARNTKAQVVFDPQHVHQYRLIGYENRDVRDADFRNNRVDAGEIGAGHEVTALYEIKLNRDVHSGRLATVRLRYEQPWEQRFVELEQMAEVGHLYASVQSAVPDLVLDACVAEFAEILRWSYWAREGSFSAILDLLRTLPEEFRAKPEVVRFEEVVERASALKR